MHRCERRLDMHEGAIGEYVKNLQCCGNCKHYFTVDCPLREEIDCYPDSTPIYSATEPDEVCDKWTFDKIAFKDRLVTPSES
jgi:hypothetical protein